ncbi:hypothetical protein JTE90_010214 [Oedothorax gibbosus]|uniref:Bromodomain adjacent to zinc finger domain protein 1A n=1 Tax=Oedothorax gibbosus TaxID=931172 RepID=A0AAV6UKW8_9ARAC|nr:hypothetical protein JTE90_010214 [Oedothorax gibbosus]
MPMKDRKPFKRTKPPKDLKPDEELFYLKATHEIFRNYDEFFERVILCNSLVWSCSLTGKSSLTFQEALASEQQAREQLRSFPLALRKPLLYLATLSHKKRLNDMCDDVFAYVKDRFFVGEEVEVTLNGIKKSSEVTQVLLPEQKAAKSPSKADSSKQKKKDIAPSKIKYEVVNYSTGRTTVVKPDCMSRPKGTLTKPLNKLFLKHHTEPKDGVWKVKDSVVEKEQLDEFPFSEVHCGPLPAYAQEKPKTPLKKINEPTSAKKTVQGKLNFKKESADEKRKSLDKQAMSIKQKMETERERMRIKEEMRKQKLEEMKEKQKEERMKKREEKKIMTEYLNNWKKPRDDLECDDLKDLPPPVPVDCGIPHSCFGDALMIVEFLNTFEKQVQVKDVFPHGCTFEHVAKALVETDIQGVLNDLLQLFLTAIFRYQEAEDDAIDIRGLTLGELGHMTIDEATDFAAIVSTWPQKYHGTILRNIPLDSFSVSEVLRLHVLSSGSKRRVNWQGVISPSEDPGLFFKMEEPELLKKLTTSSVFEFNPEERCKVLCLLVHQLLSCDVLRYAVDENADKTKPLRYQLKQLRWAHSRWEKEGVLGNKKKPKENKPEANGDTPDTPMTVDEEEKENEDNLTPEEKAQLEEKREKESAKHKAEFQRKEREIEAQIRKLQFSFNVVPLGRDRAFRRYWVFQTVAGIFVEDDDPFKGVCLPRPTVQAVSNAHGPQTAATNIKKYLQNMDTKGGGTGSDKENEILRDIAIVQSDLAFPLKNRKLSDLNPRVDSKKGIVPEGCTLCNGKKMEKDSASFLCPHLKGTPDQCTADPDTCPVHNYSASRWSFYHRAEDVDLLLATLNERGFRERQLQQALLSEQEQIKEQLEARVGFAHAFNTTLPPPPQPEVRKSQRNNQGAQLSSSSYAGMSPREAQELTLRDMILELEHRIFHGGLGSLKVDDREKWRTALEQGAFDLQTGVKSEADKGDSKEEAKIFSTRPVEELVQEMGFALHQLSQGIESKYLNPPLGKSEKAKQRAAEADTLTEAQLKERARKEKPDPLLLWQESVVKCSSHSQLFVHLGTLERSVAWSRSVLRAHCRICRRRGDGENMLLCDGCNRGHHLYCLKPPLKCIKSTLQEKGDGENMLLCDGCNRGHHLYCLKPPLKTIPEGDWFCLSCKPVEKPQSPQKKPSRYVEESESENEETSDNEQEQSDEEAEEGEDEESNEAADAEVEEQCEACGEVGTLLCCDKCPLMYHQECVNLKRIPRGEWLCPKCTKKEEAVKKANKHPASGSYGTRSSTLTNEDKNDKKKNKGHIKTKFAPKGTKRKYEDSFKEDYAAPPPSKRSNRDRKSNPTDSEREDNPFKKVYRDSASRRSNRGSGAGDLLDYKTCIDLLAELMKHPSSWPFLVPVSKKDAPDYHLIIKRPMDFGTIRSKLNSMSYRTNDDFVRDVHLVLQNCEWFNPKASPEFKCAKELAKEVTRLLNEYQLSPPTLNGDRD